MKYLLGVGLATVLLVGSSAQAVSIPVVWTTENFNSYAQGTILGQIPGWSNSDLEDYVTHTMRQPTVRGGGGDNQIRLWGRRLDDGSGDWSDAWNGDDGWTEYSAGVVGIVTFDLWAQLGAINASRGDHFTIQISDQNDAKLGSVNGYSSSVKIKDQNGDVLSEISYADGVHHNLAFIVDPIAGTVDYLLDDVSVGTRNVGTGRSLGWIYVRDNGTVSDSQDIIRLDNIIAGTPEPTSLVLLGLGGLMILRRRVQ